MKNSFQHLLTIFAAFLFGVCATLLPRTGDAAGAGELLRVFLVGLESFSAEFEQQVVNEFDEPVESSTGTLYVQRPGQFHWHYTHPYAQQIISDGNSLWVYDADLEQVTIKDVQDSIDSSPAAILGGDVDIEKLYVVIDAEPTQGVQWVELTPRDIESQYNTIRIGFVDAQLAGMELSDNLGQKTQIAFLDAKRNVPVDPALFAFTPPDGVDVIDSRE